MHPADIQACLKKKGLTQKALAERVGRSQQTVGRVILKKTISDHVMRAIAEAIGLDKEQVFPEYYLAPPKRSTSMGGRG